MGQIERSNKEGEEHENGEKNIADIDREMHEKITEKETEKVRERK